LDSIPEVSSWPDLTRERIVQENLAGAIVNMANLDSTDPGSGFKVHGCGGPRFETPVVEVYCRAKAISVSAVGLWSCSCFISTRSSLCRPASYTGQTERADS